MNTSWQKTISDAVKARGYDGYGMTREQFAFSQVCKAIEELSEVCFCFGVGNYPFVVMRTIKLSAECARGYFNNPKQMGPVELNRDCVAKELADVLITLAVAADAIGMDLESFAIDKVTRDITRGVRIGTENTL